MISVNCIQAIFFSLSRHTLNSSLVLNFRSMHYRSHSKRWNNHLTSILVSLYLPLPISISMQPSCIWRIFFPFDWDITEIESIPICRIYISLGCFFSIVAMHWWASKNGSLEFRLKGKKLNAQKYYLFSLNSWLFKMQIESKRHSETLKIATFTMWWK